MILLNKTNRSSLVYVHSLSLNTRQWKLFCFLRQLSVMLTISTFLRIIKHRVHVLEVRRLGKGVCLLWAIQLYLVNADTNRKLIRFCVRWAIGGGQLAINAKLIFIDELCSSHRVHWSECSYKVSFAEPSRHTDHANLHTLTHAPDTFLILLMSIQSEMALFCMWVCHPFRADTGVCNTIWLASDVRFTYKNLHIMSPGTQYTFFFIKLHSSFESYLFCFTIFLRRRRQFPIWREKITQTAG